MRSRNVSPGLAVMRTTISVGEHARAAGDRRAVAARLADHRRRLAGDRRLVDAGDALDDVAVARDHLAGHDDDLVAEVELRAGHLLDRCRRAARRLAIVSERVLRSVSACALPRPSATASAKFANSTVNQRNSGDERRRTRSRSCSPSRGS